MVFNNDKNGFENETNFVNKINNKRFNELDYNLQLFINDLYDSVNANSKIKCFKNEKLQKYDIIININDNIKRVS